MSTRAAPLLYYRSAPGVWFAQLESFFKLNGVKEDDRYHFIVAALPEDIAVRIINCGEQDYDALKTRLMEEQAATLHERIQNPLSEISLDGCKPSTVVNNIRR